MRKTELTVEWSDGSGESDFNALLGAHVRLHGLHVRPELNGRLGRVFSWHEEDGRAGVCVDGVEGMLAIRPANLGRLSREEYERAAAEAPSFMAASEPPASVATECGTAALAQDSESETPREEYSKT
mmetsp:Transcript_14564/g.31571  ORF Transcript_14564/g.31571 Transcript_14564/m.31571 type:complete len:127 (-) Transcript_14564:317-697(-)